MNIIKEKIKEEYLIKEKQVNDNLSKELRKTKQENKYRLLSANISPSRSLLSLHDQKEVSI